MPSSSDDSIRVLEAGLCASWARQVAVSGGGTLSRLGGLLVALSGVPDQTQQVALVERPIAQPSASVVAAEAVFRSAGWDPALDLVRGAHPGVEEVLVERGYRVVAERPGMMRALRDRDRRDHDRGVVAASAGQLAELALVQARAFGIDGRIAALLLPPASMGIAGLEILVALDGGGRVVGGLSLHIDGGVAGIVGAAVEPAWQRQGIGSALTRAALGRAVAAGAASVWLQATTAGLALWRRHGFEEVGKCQVWLVSHDGGSELRGALRPTGL